MSDKSKECCERLLQIPSFLRIRVIHVDDAILVIRKPSLLLSVPSKSSELKSDSSKPSTTIQQVWTEVISSFRMQADINNELNLLQIERYLNDITVSIDQVKAHTVQLLTKLGCKTKKDIGCISRKCKLFKKYVLQNNKTLLSHLTEVSDERQSREHYINIIAQIVYDLIWKKTQSLYAHATEKERTKEEESAYGQIQLLSRIKDASDLILNAYGSVASLINTKPDLFTVHRLDCETSGTMVFARNNISASKLSEEWRGRDKVSKIYLARVRKWPPFDRDGMKSGEIDLPLAPMKDQKLKWEVSKKASEGKQSLTKWKIFADEESNEQGRSFTTLELKPITGRTHQLRVHVSNIGSGIIGDSLYGENRIHLDLNAAIEHEPKQTLRLHAYKLQFPHPKDGSLCMFHTEHSWPSIE
ncbi:hypothetical protein CTEN210_17454 [Chaetoceros tenuissimus]|uniref:Pseudouridine synthase RsuA/RluA-like domain-containing protein n=1 Tax=Chaetoceros tenuissimus TaxID=426638 RepID=A0AAD3HFE4_9STRA|nr:hypothetical protein CTEN210_17454 [Chaetoceros tenuissimus]